MKQKKESNISRENNDKKRIITLDVLRVLACFLVCYCHIISESQYIYNTPIGANWLFVTITFIFSKIAVPIFFMISGVLLLREEQDLKKMLKKSLCRIIIPLFVCSSFIYFKDNPSVGITNIINFFENFVKGTILSPYWYLYSLLGIYIMTPFISNFVKNISTEKYKQLMIIGFVLIILLKTVNELKVSSSFDISLSANFYYFLLGYYIYNKCKYNMNQIVCANIISVITLIISIIIIINGNVREEIKLIGSINLLAVFILSVTTFITIKFLYENKKNTPKTQKIVQFISPLTFCVYLIHVVFLGKLRFILEFLMTYLNDVLSIIVYSGIFFGCMILISYVIKKIPYVKEYI